MPDIRNQRKNDPVEDHSRSNNIRPNAEMRQASPAPSPVPPPPKSVQISLPFRWIGKTLQLVQFFLGTHQRNIRIMRPFFLIHLLQIPLEIFKRKAVFFLCMIALGRQGQQPQAW